MTYLNRQGFGALGRYKRFYAALMLMYLVQVSGWDINQHPCNNSHRPCVLYGECVMHVGG